MAAFGDVASETDGTGAVQASYVLGPAGPGTGWNELLAQTRGSVTSYALHDGQGSVRTLVDHNADVTDQYTYDAYGNLVSRTGTTENPYEYDGQYLDGATGLYDLRAREYDTAAGRFTSRDPEPVLEEGSDAGDRYVYAAADPVGEADPAGRDGRAPARSRREGESEYGLLVSLISAIAWAAAVAIGAEVVCMLVRDTSAIMVAQGTHVPIGWEPCAEPGPCDNVAANLGQDNNAVDHVLSGHGAGSGANNRFDQKYSNEAGLASLLATIPGWAWEPSVDERTGTPTCACLWDMRKTNRETGQQERVVAPGLHLPESPKDARPGRLGGEDHVSGPAPLVVGGAPVATISLRPTVSASCARTRAKNWLEGRVDIQVGGAHLLNGPVPRASCLGRSPRPQSPRTGWEPLVRPSIMGLAEVWIRRTQAGWRRGAGGISVTARSLRCPTCSGCQGRGHSFTVR